MRLAPEPVRTLRRKVNLLPLPRFKPQTVHSIAEYAVPAPGRKSQTAFHRCHIVMSTAYKIHYRSFQ